MWRFRKVNPRWDELTLAFEDVRLWPFLANVASIRDSPSDPFTADVAEPNDCNVITRRRFVRRRRVAGPLFNHYLLSYPDDLHGESQVAAAGGWRREDVVYVPASFENSRACSTLPAVGAMMKAIADGKTKAACGALADFINQVSGQRGKAISAGTADAWIDTASQLETAIGC